MHERHPLPAGALALAARQGQVLSRSQLAAFGVGDRVLQRLLREGRLERIARGIYATGYGGWSQQAWAGVLIGGPRAVLGLEAAAHLDGLVRQPPGTVAVFTPQQHIVVDPRWRWIRAERAGRGEPPRTRLAQTVFDLSRELTPDAMVGILAEALYRRPLVRFELRELLEAGPRHPGRGLLGELLADVVEGVESALELRYVRTVERPHHLPVAIRQASPAGVHRTDGWYLDYGVLLELDGRAHHSGSNSLADYDRDNLHRIRGLFTLRYGWKHVVGDPCGVARQVAQALQSRGWQGAATTCPRCRKAPTTRSV
jgi:very-short-patch-repair endonuclease